MILALDSSTSQGSVALVDGSRVVWQVAIETPRGRGGALFSALEEILRKRPDIRRVVAGTGPGSYNGIRSALAVAWGIATARGVPLVGTSSLLALAEGEYCAVGDARCGQFYFARVSEGRFLTGPVLFEREALRREIDGAGERPLFLPSAIDFLPQGVIAAPDAARLARIGAGGHPSRDIPEPLYLKPAHITAAKAKS